MKSVTISRHAAITSIAFLAIGLASCKSNPDNAGMAMATGPQQLPVVSVQRGEAKDTLQFTASIQGTNNVNIMPQISGYLTKIYVDEGQYVHQGQLLFQIDSRPYREQLAAAESQLKAAEANLLSAKIGVDKQTPLVDKKVVAAINLKQANANYESVRATVAQARAAVQSAKINLSYCSIHAPVSGYIGTIPNKLGSLVTPASPQPLTILSKIDRVYAYFSMSEEDYMNFQKTYQGNTIQEKIHNAPAVSLRLSDGSIFGQEGKIQIVEGQFDQSTASIQFRAVFDNPGGLLRTGNTGTILLPQQNGQALLVPIASTIDLQDKVFVWKVDNQNKVHQAILNITGKTGDYYVVTEGLNESDKIVASGFDRLTENAAIKPVAGK